VGAALTACAARGVWQGAVGAGAGRGQDGAAEAAAAARGAERARAARHGARAAEPDAAGAPVPHPPRGASLAPLSSHGGGRGGGAGPTHSSACQTHSSACQIHSSACQTHSSAYQTHSSACQTRSSVVIPRRAASPRGAAVAGGCVRALTPRRLLLGRRDLGHPGEEQGARGDFMAPPESLRA
jgi:hypothetical protein